MNQYDYFSDIESTFVRCRGQNLFLSPKDWALIQSWKDRGVPLHVALTAIEEVFKDKGKQVRISSLAYVSPAIEDRFATWTALHTGDAVYEAPAISCTVCNDLGEITRKPSNAQFEWELEFLPCPHCKSQ